MATEQTENIFLVPTDFTEQTYIALEQCYNLARFNNAITLVRESTCPVLTIRGKKHKKGCENIVLPLDLTKETREKVAKAIEFAKYFDASVRVVSVLASKKEENENKLIAYSAQVRDF